MQKVIENATLKIVQAMEKNRNAYNEADEWYKDTGYNRYWKKMEKIDAEYEELRDFLHPEEKIEVQPETILRCYELERMLKNVKSKVFYMEFDFPANSHIIGLKELLRDI